MTTLQQISAQGMASNGKIRPVNPYGEYTTEGVPNLYLPDLEAIKEHIDSEVKSIDRADNQVNP